jgi:hypothetical protein
MIYFAHNFRGFKGGEGMVDQSSSHHGSQEAEREKEREEKERERGRERERTVHIMVTRKQRKKKRMPLLCAFFKMEKTLFYSI